MANEVKDFNAADFGLGDLDSFEEGGENQSGKPIDNNALDLSRMKMVLDVPLKVTVELGRTKLLVNDLLQLGQGSVIELDKMAGEPMEIYVNEKLVAMG
jgi:flagellar motor switch protein FliN